MMMMIMMVMMHAFCKHAPSTTPTCNSPQLVIEKLERRALHADASMQPAPHCVLYDLLLSRCSFKAAAAAMLGRARQLRAASTAGRLPGEMHAVAAEVQGAYGACHAPTLHACLGHATHP
jgi:hypothetical protein